MVSAEEPGEILIQFTDKQFENGKLVYRVHSSAASQAAKAAVGVNRTACPELPAVALKAAGYIRVMFKSDAADTVESEESSLTLPIVIMNRATGQIESEMTLTFDNMTGFTTAGTADVICAASIPVHIAYWEVPDGKLAMLGAGKKFHFYMGDDT